MKRIAAIASAFVLSLAVGFGVASAFGSQQVLSGSMMASAIQAGTFTQINGCNYAASGNQVLNAATFRQCVQNNGSCNQGGNASYVMDYADMQACAVNHTVGIAITDSCITSSANWPTVSGTPAYAANGTGTSCGSTGNYMHGATIGQTLNGGSPIAANTIVNVSAYLESTTQTVTVGDPVNCTQNSATATGTAQLELVQGSTVVKTATLNSGSGAWSQQSLSYAVPASAVLSVRLVGTDMSASATGSTQNIRQVCVSSTRTAHGYGYATAASASSS